MLPGAAPSGAARPDVACPRCSLARRVRTEWRAPSYTPPDVDTEHALQEEGSHRVVSTLTAPDEDRFPTDLAANQGGGGKPAVMVAHNRYRQRGGEDAVFEQEVELLKRNGHRVTTFVVENGEEIAEAPGIRESVALSLNTVWSRGYARRIRAAIRRDRPDVLHVHNTFPLLSPSVYRAAATMGVPVVQTLHNFRLICPTATLFRDGHICHDCPGRTVPWPGVLHACYRDSRVESAVVAGMLGFHNVRRTWTRDVDAYIVLSEFARRLFADAGLPAARMIVKSNFVEPDPGTAAGPGHGFLFVGRLTVEKGPLVALDAWDRVVSDAELTMIGSGPMLGTVEQRARTQDRVRVAGEAARSDVLAAVKQARAVIVPSIWYEGVPLTILEAFACGRPVIASRIGALSEIVRDRELGLLFEPGDAAGLAAAVDWAAGHPDEMERMGQAARREYEQAFTGERNYEQLAAIYERVIAGRVAGKARGVPGKR